MKTGSRSSLWMTADEMHGSKTGAVGPKEELWAAAAGSSEEKEAGLSWVWEKAGSEGTK